LDSQSYAEFLRALGHRVVSVGSFSWYDANRFFYLSAPPHRTYEPTAEQLRAALRTLPCLGVRYAAPLEGEGKLSYQIVCAESDYGLDKLSGNTRSKVRRGFIGQKYASLIEGLYSGAGHVNVEAQVTYEDGRVGTVRADVRIAEAQVAAAGAAR